MHRILISLLLPALLSGCYSTKQTYHHAGLYLSRRPIPEVLEDTSVSDSVKKRLTEVQKIISFAKEQGLNTEESYTSYVQLERSAVSYLVEAAEPYELKSVTWWFPFVGTVPYLGFYDEKERDEKAKELKEEGYDVDTGEVGAFSSLGWFEDPIFSPMLRRSTLSLTHLLFHELTHRTLWLSGHTKFNENLAEFVAYKLTKKFVSASELKRYALRRSDKKLFVSWLKKLKSELKELYAGESKSIALEKKRLFEKYVAEKPIFTVIDYVGKTSWNNASVLGASLYSPDLSRFEKAWGCLESPSVKLFIHELSKGYDSRGEPYTALDSLCAGS